MISYWFPTADASNEPMEANIATPLAPGPPGFISTLPLYSVLDYAESLMTAREELGVEKNAEAKDECDHWECH